MRIGLLQFFQPADFSTPKSDWLASFFHIYIPTSGLVSVSFSDFTIWEVQSSYFLLQTYFTECI
ncbi:MAG: hypothetical protein IKO59_06510 [Bacteroidales bacterium]|nr:hypothetical protein [Bacteroidales bacterium]